MSNVEQTEPPTSTVEEQTSTSIEETSPAPAASATDNKKNNDNTSDGDEKVEKKKGTKKKKEKKAKGPTVDYSDAAKFFENSKGIPIYYERHLSANESKANIFLVHGLAEHSGSMQWQENLIPALVKQDYNVFIMDHQSHGKSGGKVRCHIKKFQYFVDDFQQFVDLILKDFKKENEEQSIPNFLMAHSLGGLIGFEVVNERPELFKGAVLNGSAFYVNPKLATPTIKFIAKTLSSVAPTTAIADKLETTKLSRDPRAVELAGNDELRYLEGSRARLVHETLTRIDLVGKRLNAFKSPVLFTHGTADEICLPLGSQQLYDGVGSEDKELKLYEGMFHETYCETSLEVIDDSLAWIAARL